MRAMVDSEIEIVDKVFKRFQVADDRQSKWTDLDSNMELLEYLDDDQMVREAEAILREHNSGKPQCKYTHREGEECFVPVILEAVTLIVDDYKSVGILEEDHRYVLCYYVSLASVGEITY